MRLWRALLAGLLPLLLLAGLGQAVQVRRRAGAELAAAKTDARAPRLALPAEGLIDAVGPRDGAMRLAALAADRASAAGLQLATRLPDDAQAAGVATIDCDVQGGEAALRDFAAALESGRPFVRFARWRLVPAGVGVLRLTGRLVAPLRMPDDGTTLTIATNIPPALRHPDGGALFATDPAIDVVPATMSGGPPQLVGIVGRLSDPQVMIRLADGTMRTIGRGAVAEGWRLVAVATDRASFRKGREERAAVLPTQAGDPQ